MVRRVRATLAQPAVPLLSKRSLSSKPTNGSLSLKVDPTMFRDRT